MNPFTLAVKIGTFAFQCSLMLPRDVRRWPPEKASVR